MTAQPRHSPARRSLVLLNPKARRGQGRERYTAVKTEIEKVFDARIVETDPTGNDAPIRAALADGIRIFIAADGDGTVNAVLDALVRLRETIALDDLTLGAVGLGLAASITIRRSSPVGSR